MKSNTCPGVPVVPSQKRVFEKGQWFFPGIGDGMSVADLLRKAASIGVMVEVAGDGELLVDYPKGADVGALLSTLRQHRDEIATAVLQSPRLALYRCGECGDRFWHSVGYDNAGGCPACNGKITLTLAAFPTETVARAFLAQEKQQYGADHFGIDALSRRPMPPLPPSVRACLDYLSKHPDRDLTPKLHAWLDSEWRKIERYERIVCGCG